jgi:hypothetical protein
MRNVTIGLISAVLVLASGSGSSAKEIAPVLEGRHAVLRAEMYARALTQSGTRIQVLDRLCVNPGRRPSCEPVTNLLRRDIEAAVTVPVRWVSRERSHGGAFWALGPVFRSGSHAHFVYRWDDPSPSGCSGNGRVEFRRIDWTGWVETADFGSIGCPVVTDPRSS